MISFTGSFFATGTFQDGSAKRPLWSSKGGRGLQGPDRTPPQFSATALSFPLPVILNGMDGRRCSLWLRRDNPCRPGWQTLTPLPSVSSLSLPPPSRSLDPPGPRPSQPARRRLHQWASPAESHPTQDCGDGAPRHQALRDLSPAPGLPRLRLQDPLPVPRNGIHPAGSHRWQQAQGE